MSSEAERRDATDDTAAALQVIRPESDPRLIINEADAEVVKGKQHHSSAWLHSPAYLVLMRTAHNRLLRLAELRGEPTTRVTKVRVARLKGQKQIYIYPTSMDDLDGIPVSYAKSNAYINLISFLSPAGLTMQKGYRAWYEVKWASTSSPVGPALVIDLGRPMERKPMTRRRPPLAAPAQQP